MTDSNEPKELRDRRRAASQWLTAQANDFANVRDSSLRTIRREVLTALASLDQRLSELNGSLRDSFHLGRDVQVVRFYMKGGNAYDCLTSEAARNDLGGGASDWDTQVLIDPWAPETLQALALERVEDLVTDTMVKVGVVIADLRNAAMDTLIKSVPMRWAIARVALGPQKLDMMDYELSLDDPQSLRRVFDQRRLGLWTNDRRPLAAPQIQHPEWIPGILLNDAIRPFILYRMGFTWHANPDPPEDRNVPAIVRPLLMELIDVTVPRRGTIEAVGVWEQLARKTITVTPYPVSVRQGDARSAPVSLPLPDVVYHVMEMATMLSEIADRSSKHEDKLPKRFKRVAAIWDTALDDLRQNIVRLLSGMAGIADIANPVPAIPQDAWVDAQIDKHAGDDATKNKIMSDERPWVLLRRLMYRVAHATQTKDFDEDGKITPETLRKFDAPRERLASELGQAIDMVPPDLKSGILDAAFSDDLVLNQVLEEEEYLSASKIGFSGIRMGVVQRVASPMHMDALATALHQVWLKNGDKAGEVRVLLRRYSVRRDTGVSHEVSLVKFVGGEARAVGTVTTAQPGEAPFRIDMTNPKLRVASLPELAMQRKVAAALIDAYSVRKVLERQYEAIHTLLPEG